MKPRISPTRKDEAGYLLIGVLFLVALVLVALAVAAPRVVEDLRRDREQELVHRGMQYARAVRLYYRKFGRYPASLEQLEKTNEIRFLRKRYADPITGKAEWRMIRFGESKVKSTGLFGQPLPGSSPGAPGAAPTSASPGGVNAGLATGSPLDSNLGSSQGLSGPGSPGALGSGGSGFNNGPPGGFSLGGGSNSPGGLNSINAATTNQTFGGAGIVGVSSTSDRESIREYHKQKHYNDWEFTYDPRQDLNGVAGQNGTGVQQQPQNTSPFSPSGPGFGGPSPGNPGGPGGPGLSNPNSGNPGPGTSPPTN